MCLRRKKTVIFTVILFLIAAAAYLSTATRVYTSTSRLFVEQNGPRLLAPDSQSALERSESYLFRQCQVIKAEPILRQAISENPADIFRMYRGLADPLPELSKNLNVDLGKKDEIISIDLSSPYPAEAARLVNSIVRCYEAYQAKVTKSSATEALTILQREKDKQEQLLDDRLKEIVAFKQKNGEMFFTNDKGTNILMQNLATISELLTKARMNAITYHVLATRQNNRMAANQEWQEAEQQVKEYEKEFDAEKQKALQINAAQAEFSKMQLEADRTTKLCDLLDARIKELNVTEDSGSMNIQVLEVAKAEDHPTSPKKSMTLMAALAAGLVVGSGLALTHDRLDQRIRLPDEAARLLGIPVLGVIPAVRDAELADRSQIGCAVYGSPCSALADAHQSLGMAVHLAWPKEDAKTMLITSPNRGDGKSTTASNLAIAMALAGRKTLLIDADLRRPVQHEIFNLLNAVGLADVVMRNVRVEQAIQRADVEGLSILTCGALPPNPAEITSGPAFAKVLRSLEESYDLIIVDSPPIFAAPDARILGAQADVALLVLRADRSTRQDAELASKRLQGVGARILGLVFNGVTQNRSANYRYDSDTYVTPRNKKMLASNVSSNLIVRTDPDDAKVLTSF